MISRTGKSFVRTATLIISMLMFNAPAEACLHHKPLDYAFLKNADIIVRARISGYDTEPTAYRATFRFDLIDPPGYVVEQEPPGYYPFSLPRAAFRKTWTAAWTNSTYGEPDTWDGPHDVIVGLTATLNSKGEADIAVVQQSCGPRSLFKDTPENWHRIMDAVRR